MDRFVEDFVSGLRAKAADLRRYGAAGNGETCDAIAGELEMAFRSWWLANLTIADAAQESGYSEERLREMTRQGTLPSHKGSGDKGHLSIVRRDLPRRPASVVSRESDLAKRLLRPRDPTLRESA